MRVHDRNHGDGWVFVKQLNRCGEAVKRGQCPYYYPWLRTPEQMIGGLTVQFSIDADAGVIIIVTNIHSVGLWEMSCIIQLADRER